MLEMVFPASNSHPDAYDAHNHQCYYAQRLRTLVLVGVEPVGYGKVGVHPDCDGPNSENLQETQHTRERPQYQGERD